MGKISKPRPLTQDDSKKTFNCGKPSLNTWLEHHAWSNQKSGVSRTNVLIDAETDRLVAFVSLANSEIRRELLVKSQQRNKPMVVPAILLGQLAIDLDYQKQGLAKSLLFFAFKTVVQIAKKTGCYCLITHPVDGNARAFYEYWGFQELPFDCDGTMIIRVVDLKSNGF